MLGYQLLDAVLDCSHWPAHAALTTIGRNPTPGMLPTKLLTIIRALRDWTDVVLQAKIAGVGESRGTPLRMPADVASAEEITFMIAVNNLQQTITHFKGSHWQHILMNIHSVAFIMRWHSPVSCPPFSLSPSHWNSPALFASVQANRFIPETIPGVRLHIYYLRS
jgi:hypothetical protein